MNDPRNIVSPVIKEMSILRSGKKCLIFFGNGFMSGGIASSLTDAGTAVNCLKNLVEAPVDVDLPVTVAAAKIVLA